MNKSRLPAAVIVTTVCMLLAGALVSVGAWCFGLDIRSVGWFGLGALACVFACFAAFVGVSGLAVIAEELGVHDKD